MLRDDPCEKYRLIGILKKRVLVGPYSLHLHIINSCNLACAYCWYHAPHQTPRGRPRFQTGQKIDTAALFKTLDECRKLRVRHICISAKGEPTVHPEFEEIVDYARSKGFLLTLQTNGTFPDRLLNAVSKINDVRINLSATTASEYQKLQANNNQFFFDQVIRNIAYLGKFPRHKLRVCIHYILNAANYQGLPAIFKIAKEFDVKELAIRYIRTNRTNQHLRLTPAILKACETILGELYRDPAYAHTNANVFYNYREFGYFLERTAKSRDPGHCYLGWFKAFLTEEGNVWGCCSVNNEFLIGNILKRSFTQLWCSREYQAFRAKGASGFLSRTFDACRSCCFLEENTNIRDAKDSLKLPSA
jgi:MoaA/NifB/PqqE/SkfB family radical SAM enzyme